MFLNTQSFIHLSARVCVTGTVGSRVFKFDGEKCLTLFISTQCIQQIFIESILDVILEHILVPHNNVIKLRDWGDGSVVKALAERV